MRKRPPFFAPSILALSLAAAAWGGCRARRGPETAFAEAERLRLQYERQASHQAIAEYGEALAAWNRKGDQRAAARACQQIGATYEQLGALEHSLKSYLEALSFSERSQDRQLESEIRSDAGMAHARLSHIEQALKQCRVALDLARTVGGVVQHAKALNCLGEVEYHRGDSAAALALYQRSLPLWESLAEPRGRADTLLFLGSAYSDLMELDKAAKCLEDTLSVWKRLGDKRGELITLQALARLQYLRGEYQEALNRYTSVRDRFQAAGDAVWEAASLTGIATVYEEMGDGRSALGYRGTAARLFETAGLQMAAIEMYMEVGNGYVGSDVSTALTWLERARALSVSTGNRHMLSYALHYIGLAHLARGDPVEALRHLGQSLDIQRSVEDPRFRARTLCGLGQAHGAQGDDRRAVEYFQRALDLSRASGDRVAQATALFGLARSSVSMNDVAAARTHIDSALNLTESLRSEVESQDLRTSYLASVHQYYELRTDVLMRLHKTHPRQGLAAAAFESSEQARARSLLDSLAEARVDLRRGLDPILLKREQALKRAFDDWAERQRRLASAPSSTANPRAMAEEYRDLERRYDQIQAEIRSRSPRYAALARPQPLGLEQVQRQVLDAGTLLLEYALGEERSHLWAVSSTNHASYELPSRAEIEQAARRLYEHLTARLREKGGPQQRRTRIEEADRLYWEEAGRLSETLLGPVAKDMAGKRLVVVADGALQYLPFAALPAPGSRGEPVPVVVEHEVVSLPSASVLAVLRRETAGRKPQDKLVAVLADPVFEADDPRLRARSRAAGSLQRQDSRTRDLAGPYAGANGALPGLGGVRDSQPSVSRLAATRLEADAIVGLAPRGMALRKTDFDASRAAAMSPELAHYRIVHFATHGVFDNDSPGLSGIVLSLFDERGREQDGFLRLHDIYGLQLPVELVVLSACNTALGRQVRGEGLVGIVRGFMYAGAKRVVASLWKVDDDATGEMMRRFYAQMLEEHRSPAAALREAQLAMWRQDRWRAPFYWAAFGLQGEWRE